jgi:hypothetical protein
MRQDTNMIDQHGLEVVIDARKLSRVDVPTFRRSIAIAMKQMRIPDTQACQVLGVCRNTYRKMAKSSDRKVPAVVGVVFGKGDWTPEVQDQDPSKCDRCHGIKRGSRLYCAACHSTGFEHALENERIDDLYAQAAEAEAEARDKRANLAQRKKRKSSG